MAIGSTFVSRGAAGYDAYMGRWSLRLAPLFLEFAGVAPGERVLEIGCGTGNLTAALAQRGDLSGIDAIDYDTDFVAEARRRLAGPNIRFEQGDASALAFPDGAYDRALSMLVLHFVADPSRAVAEMRRVLRKGGVAAACVWDLYGGMPANRLFWDPIVAIEPAMAEHWARAAFRPMTGPGELQGAFEAAGFVDVTETMLPIRMDFQNFDDFWEPTIYGQGNRAALVAQHGEERLKAAVRTAYLSGRPDGPRSFASIAWSVRGLAA
jgi:SAM-dependent methyltransferase